MQFETTSRSARGDRYGFSFRSLRRPSAGSSTESEQSEDPNVDELGVVARPGQDCMGAPQTAEGAKERATAFVPVAPKGCYGTVTWST